VHLDRPLALDLRSVGDGECDIGWREHCAERPASFGAR
jgi:hypothetical protein